MKKLFPILLVTVVCALFLSACSAPTGTKIRSELFKLKKDTLTATVSNDTREFSFEDNIAVNSNASYTVSTDSEGANITDHSKVPLSVGDNVFYITVTNNGKSKTYTANIRRKPLYTVSYQIKDVGAFHEIIVEEGTVLKKSEAPLPIGYNLTAWEYNFSKPINEYTEITGKFEPIEELKPFKFSATTDSCVITGLNDSGAGRAVIPDCVTAIGSYAFYSHGDLQFVTIGKNVTSIGDYAFYHTDIYELVIPESVTSIGRYAFSNCNDLKKLTLPQSLTYIGEHAFDYCGDIENFNIGDNVTYIGQNALDGIVHFWGDAVYVGNHLIKVDKKVSGPFTVKDGTVSIASYAFENCTNITEVILPDSVKAIGDNAFDQCSDLTSVRLGEGLTAIGQCAFRGCSSLTSLQLPKGVTSIGSGAFLSCSLLESINLPDGITEISDQLFFGCVSLTKIDIHNGITSVGNQAFNGCEKLTGITLPEGITFIGDMAFHGTAYYNNVDNWENDSLYNGSYLISVSPEAVGAYAVKAGTSTIASFAFNKCEKLTDITVPSTVKNVGNGAFNACYGLTNVSLPESITAIAPTAFSNCYSLQSINIPESVTVIGSQAFERCYGLTSFILTNGIRDIEHSAFSDCATLIEVINHSPLKITAGSDEYGKIALNAQTVHGGSSQLTVQDDFIFYKTDGTYYLLGYSGTDAELVLPESVNGKKYELHPYAFAGCVNLTDITLPSGISDIPEYAFYKCRSLRSIVIPDTVWSIGVWAFGYCSSLESVDLGDGVEEIYTSAFAYCKALKTMDFTGSVQYIGNSAFSYCSSLESVTVGRNVNTVCHWAFLECNALESAIFENTKNWVESDEDRLPLSSYSYYGSEYFEDPASAAYVLRDSRRSNIFVYYK